MLLNIFFFFVASVAMFDQDHELPDDIDHDAGGAGSMYLNKTLVFFYFTVIHIICPCPIFRQRIQTHLH